MFVRSCYNNILITKCIFIYTQACKLALDEGWAINIGGGFGHYTTNIGGGLSVYDDVLLCLTVSQYNN